MRAVDTNILVYARRQEPPEHALARELLRGLAAGVEPWVLPWVCVYEFLRVVTHPRVFYPPTSIEDACDAVGGRFFASPLGWMIHANVFAGEDLHSIFADHHG